MGGLSFVVIHDCVAIAELIEYEAMGLAKPEEDITWSGLDRR